MSSGNINKSKFKKLHFVWIILAFLLLIRSIYMQCFPDRVQATRRLLSTVENARVEEVKWLIQRGADVNANCNRHLGDIIKITPIMLAARSNKAPGVLRILIENGADINVNDGIIDQTPMMWAALRNPNPEIMRVLIENGAEIDYWLLTRALNNSNPEILRVLIENGALVNETNINGVTPLMIAATKTNPGFLRILLENGADANIMDKYGQRALDYAGVNQMLKMDVYKLLREKTVEKLKTATEILFALAKSASVDEVTRLIQEGADVNTIDDYYERTVLMRAAGHGFALDQYSLRQFSIPSWMSFGCNPDPEVLRVLIENGADVNAADKDGLTSLMLAAMVNPNPEALRILIENGANVAVRDKYGHIALDYANRNEKLKGTDALNLLREKTLSQTEYVDSKARIRYNATQELLSLAWSASVEKVIELIDKGADVNAGGLQQTPLMLAAESNSNTDVLLLLIEHGADVNATITLGITYLDFTARRYKTEVLKILSIDADDIIKDGKSPLLYAAKSTSNTVVRNYLLGIRERFGIYWQGWTPLMFAAEYNSNPEILRVLIENGADINAICGNGQTPLMLAVGGNPNPEILRILIEKGADVNITDKNGKKALYYAELKDSLKGTDALNLLREKTLSQTKTNSYQHLPQ